MNNPIPVVKVSDRRSLSKFLKKCPFIVTGTTPRIGDREIEEQDISVYGRGDIDFEPSTIGRVSDIGPIVTVTNRRCILAMNLMATVSDIPRKPLPLVGKLTRNDEDQLSHNRSGEQ